MNQSQSNNNPNGHHQRRLLNEAANKTPKVLVPGPKTDANGFSLNDEDRCPWVDAAGQCGIRQSHDHYHW